MSTVVLCGSLGSTQAMWDPQRPVLADRRAVFVEHPGHGGSPLAKLASVDDLVQRVLDVTDGTFSFIGLSLGGAIGMRLAATVPERVERLVLACTSPRFGEPEQWHERAALVRAKGIAPIVDGVMERWFTPAFVDVARYRELYLTIDPEGYARCCEALAGWDGWDDLARIEAPTLVAAGALDPTAPPEVAERIGGHIRGARVEVLDGAAHLANVERAEDFNRLLEEHLP